LVSQNDFELNAKNIDENLKKELSDLSQLEEVYIDENNDSKTSVSSEINNKSEDNIQLTPEDSPAINKVNEEIVKTNIKLENNDNIKDNSEINNVLNTSNSNTNENLKLEINNDNDLEELNLDSLDDLNFDINNLESDNEDDTSNMTPKDNTLNMPKKDEDDNVKTIVIDTKQNIGDKKFDNDRNLEINSDENTRKKVFNKYSSKKKKDFSFFSDALTD